MPASISSTCPQRGIVFSLAFVGAISCYHSHYRQTSDISRTKSHNFNVSRLVLQFSLSNPLKPGIKSRMKTAGRKPKINPVLMYVIMPLTNQKLGFDMEFPRRQTYNNCPRCCLCKIIQICLIMIMQNLAYRVILVKMVGTFVNAKYTIIFFIWVWHLTSFKLLQSCSKFWSVHERYDPASPRRDSFY